MASNYEPGDPGLASFKDAVLDDIFDALNDWLCRPSVSTTLAKLEVLSQSGRPMSSWAPTASITVPSSVIRRL